MVAMSQSQSAFAVFDIDGVVADVRHRLHHVARRPKDWSGFFAAARRDGPLPEGIALAKEYARTHRLVWLTGRPESLRGVTHRWLVAQRLPVEMLIMRPLHDRRPARLFKSERLASIAVKGEVDVVFDDDPDVVGLLRHRGWPARLAAWVPYAASLRRAQEQDGRA